MRRPPRSGAQRLVSGGLLALCASALALTGATAHALSCGGFGEFTPASPLRDSSIALPIDGQPWFRIGCGEAPTCTLYADLEGTMPLASETIVDECSGTRAIARIAPSEPLSPSTTYYVECEGEEDGAFRVRNDTNPAIELSLDSVTPRRELSSGCCEDRYLSIALGISDGRADELDDFFAEGGLMAVEFSDGALYLQDFNPGDSLWEFPDTEEDLTVTLISASGVRSQMMIRAEDFERDLAYVPCSVNDANRGIFGLWLLIPLLWLRRQGARQGAGR